MKNKSIILILLLLFHHCTQVQKTDVSTPNISKNEKSSVQNFTAKVTRIIDGDTLEVLYGELPVVIRLQHIDCPEKRRKQPFGKKSKQTLSNLCFGQNVTIKFSGEKDRNGRYICLIFNEKGLNVNQEMIRRGMAWHYKKYSSEIEYDQLEKEARKNKIGLWADPNPIPPWEWRK